MLYLFPFILLTGIWVLNKSIVSSAEDRKRHLRMIEYYIDEYFAASGDYPMEESDSHLRTLITNYTEKPFSPGLDYQVEGESGYLLQENTESWVSIFKKEKLAAKSE